MPVTQRDITIAFTVFTGHESSDSSIDFDALPAAARLGTLVLLTGVSHLDEIAACLLAPCIAPDTPASRFLRIA